MAQGDSAFRVNAYQDDQSPPAGVVAVFGATGDLNARKIAPALYNLRREGRISEKTVVVGVARRPRSDETYRQEMREAIEKFSREPLDGELWDSWAPQWYYHVTEATDTDSYRKLARRLDELQEKHGAGPNRLFYLAMTPDLFDDIVERLGEAGMTKPVDEKGIVRVIVEKPFGHDLASASRLNDVVHKHFDETQICRIDHYLGKETVQNLLVFRFANSIFEPVLNRMYVDSVQITTAETVGMEGRRGPYYEGVGAVRDMMQNHMLQVLALLAMEPPCAMDAESIRNEKTKLLRTLRPIDRHDWKSQVVRGQYLAGGDGPGYRQEEGVADDSTVETFAAFKCWIDNWRWAGVPFYLRTGKRLAAKVSEVVVNFRREPLNLFQEFGCDMGGANHLHIRIAPREGISLAFDAKVPGTRMLLRPVSMDFLYESSFESATPEGYEHLILDALQGEMTLFIRSDEVEASWRFIDSVRRSFDAANGPDLLFYRPGTWGPEQADRLFDDPYRRWHPLGRQVE